MDAVLTAIEHLPTESSFSASSIKGAPPNWSLRDELDLLAVNNAIQHRAHYISAHTPRDAAVDLPRPVKMPWHDQGAATTRPAAQAAPSGEGLATVTEMRSFFGKGAQRAGS